mmetsp:Transcript_116920/g.372268  ORF Transcript_116920/g.372268 Transcript_116920/m.372268 type:complete len:221 (+) Transcript_116920:388-1050(+)
MTKSFVPAGTSMIVISSPSFRLMFTDIVEGWHEKTTTLFGFGMYSFFRQKCSATLDPLFLAVTCHFAAHSVLLSHVLVVVMFSGFFAATSASLGSFRPKAWEAVEFCAPPKMGPHMGHWHVTASLPSHRGTLLPVQCGYELHAAHPGVTSGQGRMPFQDMSMCPDAALWPMAVMVNGLVSTPAISVLSCTGAQKESPEKVRVMPLYCKALHPCSLHGSQP